MASSTNLGRRTDGHGYRFRRSLMPNSLIKCLAAAGLMCSSAVWAQNLPITEFDFKAAEKQLKDTSPVIHTSLHKAERGPHGTRGFEFPEPTVTRVALPRPPPPPFNTEREWETYYQYCGWDAIVRATLLDSLPVLSSDGNLIYTMSHFAVVDTIKKIGR